MTAPGLIRVAAPHPVGAAFTTRAGGTSVGPFVGLNLSATHGDDAAAVRANRALLAAACGVDPERVAMARAVHGAGVVSVDAPPRPGRFVGGLRGWPDGDALVTRTPGLALVVLGADCLPVIMWRAAVPAVAAVHAGWRGLLDGVLGAAVVALGAPRATTAVVGPGAGPCCYVVDGALRRRFADRFGADVVRGDAVDLAGAARRALAQAGVPAERVRVAPGCTMCEPGRFFSHRRDGEPTGRQGGIVWIAHAPPAGGAG